MGNKKADPSNEPAWCFVSVGLEFISDRKLDDAVFDACVGRGIGEADYLMCLCK